MNVQCPVNINKITVKLAEAFPPKYHSSCLLQSRLSPDYLMILNIYFSTTSQPSQAQSHLVSLGLSCDIRLGEPSYIFSPNNI